MYYVCIENSQVSSIVDYEPNVPNSIIVETITNSQYKIISEERGYYDTDKRAVVEYPAKLIEDEKHVLMNCPVYEDLRCYLFYQASLFNVNFMQLSDDDKFIFLFTNENVYFYTAKIFNDILLKRKCILYS